ncbi:MAG: LapD/MoxY N-terminal periplasmic domain-containing protein [Gammaproteobacteria bacterium]
MAFSLNLALSINNTKAYLENESQSHAQDTATSLGLSLSPYLTKPADPTINAMIGAIFDMGYYGEIRLADTNGKELVKLSNEKKAEGVPDWFIDWLPMSPAVAKSEISSGWMQTGTIYVTVNPAYAYAALYRQTKTSLYYSLIALLMSLLILGLLLKITLASLKHIDHLAKEIADSHFITIEPLPWTTEIRNVAISMNKMSQKIKSMVSSLNLKLEQTGAELLRDELTGLFKKSVFESDLKHQFTDHGSSFLYLMKVDSLSELAKERGSKAIDLLLSEFAMMLREQIELYSSATIKAYRFYGGEFALLAQTEDYPQIEALCKSLSLATMNLGLRHNKNDLIHIGVAPIDPVESVESNLSAAQEAYEQARLIGANGFYIRTQQQTSRDISAWRTLVVDGIENASYSVSLVGKTIDFESGQVIMEEAFTQVFDEQGNAVPIAPFISIAEKHAKIVDLDKGVIQQILQRIASSGVPHPIAVNLSTHTIRNADFIHWFNKLVNTTPQTARQLIMTFSAYAITKDIQAYINFFNTVHQWGGRIMIKRFEPQSIPAELNKHLKPDFIRLARDIGAGVSTSSTKREFVQTMHDMAKLLDITLLAESISDNNDYDTLKRIGIKGASR